MAKYLFLLRHAEAVEKSPYNADKERQLTTKGLNQSVQIGAQLKTLDQEPDIVFASTADRARQTITMAADAMKLTTQKIFFEEDIYDASTRTLFQFASNLDDTHEKVMFVGHNPTLTYLAEYLTQEAIGDMTTGSVVLIRFEVKSWKEIAQGNGELVKYIQPLTEENN